MTEIAVSRSTFIVLEDVLPGDVRRTFLWLARNREIAQIIRDELPTADRRFAVLRASGPSVSRQLALVHAAEVEPAQHQRFIEIHNQLDRYIRFEDPEIPWDEWFWTPDFEYEVRAYGERRVTEFERRFHEIIAPWLYAFCFLRERELAVLLRVAPDGNPCGHTGPLANQLRLFHAEAAHVDDHQADQLPIPVEVELGAEEDEGHITKCNVDYECAELPRLPVSTREVIGVNKRCNDVTVVSEQ